MRVCSGAVCGVGGLCGWWRVVGLAEGWGGVGGVVVVVCVAVVAQGEGRRAS